MSPVEGGKTYTFTFTEKQAEALIEFGAAMERWIKRPSPLDDATVAMDEQLAEQRNRERFPDLYDEPTDNPEPQGERS